MLILVKLKGVEAKELEKIALLILAHMEEKRILSLGYRQIVFECYPN